MSEEIQSSKHLDGESDLRVWLPYSVAILVQLPLLMVFAKNCWDHKPYFCFFPFALLFLGLFLWLRWPRSEGRFRESRFSDVLLVIGALVGVANSLFLLPYLAVFSCVLLLVSLLNRTMDANSPGRSLVSMSYPFLVFLFATPLVRLDVGINRIIEKLSVGASSLFLDIIGYRHYVFRDGLMVTPDVEAPFNVDAACNGSFSFFAILFASLAVGCWFKRSWFRALTLGVGAIVWTVVLNTIRIAAIPVINRLLGAGMDPNASGGTGFEIIIIGVGLLLVISTDQFLEFIFGPVDADAGDSGWSRIVVKFWNYLAGEAGRDKSYAMSSLSRNIVLGSAGLLILGGLWQAIDVFRSMSKVKSASALGSLVTQEFEQADLPDQLENWTLLKREVANEDDDNEAEKTFVSGYQVTKRNVGSDSGLRTDSWNYLVDDYEVQFALDQAFPGWHELTANLRSHGWKIEGARQVGEHEGWGYVEAKLTRESKQQAYLIFSEFDLFGEPLEAPDSWSFMSSVSYGMGTLMSNKVRGSLFRSEVFQVRAMATSFDTLSDDEVAEIKARYLELRKQIHDKFKQKRGL